MGLLKRSLDWRLRNVAAIDTDEAGFGIRLRRTSHKVAWREIEAVTAFKRDDLIVDRLCLLVQHAGSIIELDEDMAGFEKWLAMLESRLSLNDEWRAAVLFPPFEAQVTEIFRRKPVSVSCGEQA
ncbi:hypothetical protein [Novosphingobium soli]|uniref:Uncharacterized protein n=1 Tax=Novosphingobium soli TaxID=574956 RepID=A0ABV6CRM6_9SPHN